MSDASGLYGGAEKGIHVFVGKPEGRTLFGRPARRLEFDIKIEPEDRRWEDLVGFIWLRTATSCRLFSA